MFISKSSPWLASSALCSSRSGAFRSSQHLIQMESLAAIFSYTKAFLRILMSVESGISSSLAASTAFVGGWNAA